MIRFSLLISVKTLLARLPGLNGINDVIFLHLLDQLIQCHITQLELWMVQVYSDANCFMC